MIVHGLMVEDLAERVSGRVRLECRTSGPCFAEGPGMQNALKAALGVFALKNLLVTAEGTSNGNVPSRRKNSSTSTGWMHQSSPCLSNYLSTRGEARGLVFFLLICVVLGCPCPSHSRGILLT